MIEWTPKCVCDACQALQADRPSQWGWLPGKLLIRGWAGQTDRLESAFIRAHASWAQVPPERAAERAARMREGKAEKRAAGRPGSLMGTA
jgi:hypothetical protein